MSSSKDKKRGSHFGPKVKPKNGVYHFYPYAKSRREQIVKTSRAIFQGASAYYAQNSIAPPKQAVCRFSDNFFLQKF